MDEKAIKEGKKDGRHVRPLNPFVRPSESSKGLTPLSACDCDGYTCMCDQSTDVCIVGDYVCVAEQVDACGLYG